MEQFYLDMIRIYTCLEHISYTFIYNLTNTFQDGIPRRLQIDIYLNPRNMAALLRDYEPPSSP